MSYKIIDIAISDDFFCTHELLENVRGRRRIIDIFDNKINFGEQFHLYLASIHNFLPSLSRRTRQETNENAPVSLSTGSFGWNTILGHCLTWINVFTIWRRCARMHLQKIRNESAVVNSLLAERVTSSLFPLFLEGKRGLRKWRTSFPWSNKKIWYWQPISLIRWNWL